MASPLDVDDLRPRVQSVLDEFVAEQRGVLSSVSEDLDPLADAIADLIAGGKRLRPAFCWWGYRGAGGGDSDAALRAASALEFQIGRAHV